ncbi:MAG: hypothetical protein HXL74_00325 [[Eubacterium] brachy]|jgi:hypothetical protein|nr:hypothetical protein HMPREF9089_00299 [Eubacterium brachy ATCC 33089]MBF1133634.1 hypothetical protein [[Eubacterium] brachy]
MSENRSRGSVLILITSPLILLGGIVLRVKSIMDITGENRSIATMHLIFTVAISLFALLVYVSVAIFGFKHSKNVDAAQALINRGIFVLVFNVILAAYQSVFFESDIYKDVWYHLVYIIIPLLYIIGGILNKRSRDK